MVERYLGNFKLCLKILDKKVEVASSILQKLLLLLWKSRQGLLNKVFILFTLLDNKMEHEDIGSLLKGRLGKFKKQSRYTDYTALLERNLRFPVHSGGETGRPKKVVFRKLYMESNVEYN